MRIFLLILCLAGSSLAQAQNEVVSAGYDIPEPQTVASGQVITLFVRGLTAQDAFAQAVPLPTTLAGITVRVKTSIQNYPDRLPIFSVRSYDFCTGRTGVPCPLTHITVQIPTEPTCVRTGLVPNECTIGPPPVVILTVEQDGVAGKDFQVIVTPQMPHIVNACDTIFGGIGGICDQFVTHGDGTLVSCGNPAKPAETIVVYAVGIGPTNPVVKTGEAPALPAPKALLDLPLIVSFRLNLPPASPAPPVLWSPLPQWIYPEYVGLVPSYVGLYQINIKVPVQLPPNVDLDGYSTMRVAIGADPADGGAFTDICVKP